MTDKDDEKGGTSTQMILVVAQVSDGKLFRIARDHAVSRKVVCSRVRLILE